MKKLQAFLIKKTPLHAGLGSQQQNFLKTVKQLIRKNSICCLKNQDFQRANIQIDLTTPFPCSFSFGFKGPPPSLPLPLHNKCTF